MSDAALVAVGAAMIVAILAIVGLVLAWITISRDQ
jgi:hypothetical protein